MSSKKLLKHDNLLTRPTIELTPTAWLESSVELAPGSSTRFADLYDAYYAGSVDNKVVPVGKKTFAQAVRNCLRAFVETNQVKFFTSSGITIKGILVTKPDGEGCL